MNRIIQDREPTVSQNDERYWIDEYRQEGFKRQAMPHIIYHHPFQLCPWPGCGFRIAAIDFRIEKIDDPNHKKELLAAWWQGPGFIGRCPGCGKYVLYSMDGKQSISDAAVQGYKMLPEDWYQSAFLPD